MLLTLAITLHAAVWCFGSAAFCPEIEPIDHGSASSGDRPPYEDGAAIDFTCDMGYKATGKRRITCKDGRWSDPIPYCSATSCRKKLSKVEKGRKCRKPCASDKDCKGSLKKCLCDGWCGKSCFNPNANCSILSPPENGYILKNEMSYGHTVTYGCNKGYLLAGRTTRVCQSDKKWSGYDPRCAEYGTCGQAGEVGSIRKFVSRGRVIGGDNAADRTWPWQALISTYDEVVLISYSNIVGGGSLINDRWVLTAASLFDGRDRVPGWEKGFLISLGITRRPRTNNTLQRSVRMFQSEKIYQHEETRANDVALIKLGTELRLSEDGTRIQLTDRPEKGSVTFTPSIRPVCLPCYSGSCLSKILTKQDSNGRVLLTGNETPEEKCRIEYDFLMGKNERNYTAVVATGFGHTAPWRPDQAYPRTYGSVHLQQAILQIEDRQRCKETVRHINKISRGTNSVFTDGMFCATGLREAHPGQSVVDTCVGDAGGPLVREVRDDSTKESCFVQLGIVSWGWGCGQMQFINGKPFYYPAFYTDVAKMMSWINKTMNAEDESKD